MPVILQQLVTTREGFSNKPAVIEIHDDHRFVMFKIDPKSQLRTDTLIDAPAGSLAVNGNQSFLFFKSGNVKRRIDFKNPNQTTGLLAGGLIGAAIANGYANRSGIRAWVDALRTHGARVKYSGMSASMKVLIAFVILLLVSILLFPVLSPLLE